MFHLYIYTPRYKNSNAIAHIIEHCCVGKINIRNFFDFRYIEEGCSTYYSYYILNTQDRNILENFIQQIASQIPKDIIDYEYTVLKKECQDKSYGQKLITKIGKKLYGSDFQYAHFGKKIYKDIHTYHQQYYKHENIIILEDTIQYGKNIELVPCLQIKNTFHFNTQGDTDIVYIWKHNIIDMYIIGILSELFDYYIQYLYRYTKQIYYTDSYRTIYGDFEDYIYLAITPETKTLLKNIDNTFLQKYIQYTKQEHTHLQDKDFDGACMIKYGYTLSNTQKTQILENIETYYLLYREQI